MLFAAFWRTPHRNEGINSSPLLILELSYPYKHSLGAYRSHPFGKSICRSVGWSVEFMSALFLSKRWLEHNETWQKALSSRRDAHTIVTSIGWFSFARNSCSDCFSVTADWYQYNLTRSLVLKGKMPIIYQYSYWLNFCKVITLCWRFLSDLFSQQTRNRI